jgi:hypothetical protein
VSATLDPPDLDGALVTAGVALHFIASDPEITERFARYVEHCPGDLDVETVIWYLGLVHDLIAPECLEPIGFDPRRAGL